MRNVKRIEGGGNKDGFSKRMSYYDWDKKYNKGWLPGGADNPITSFAKGVLKITTGIDIPNPNKFKTENPSIKTWEDRNVKNIGSKLNP